MLYICVYVLNILNNVGEFGEYGSAWLHIDHCKRDIVYLKSPEHGLVINMGKI